jgi:hypothetical protein
MLCALDEQHLLAACIAIDWLGQPCSAMEKGIGTIEEESIKM